MNKMDSETARHELSADVTPARNDMSNIRLQVIRREVRQYWDIKTGKWADKLIVVDTGPMEIF